MDNIVPITWIELGSAIALTLAVTVVVVTFIREPLAGVLDLVCGEPAASRFWATFASIMLVFGPLFLVCFAAGRAANLAEFIRQAVYLISFGLIAAFSVMGLAVLYSVRNGDQPASGKPVQAGSARSAPTAEEPSSAPS